MNRFVVYDVFTDRAFGGNQLAVIPDASNLPDEQLQKIAREFNFSETTFVYPPELSSNTAKVRIFTPTMEVPFAGHPVIGTAVALHQGGANGRMVLELGIGPIPCQVEDGTAQFTTTAKLETLAQPNATLIARALGIDVAQLKTETHAPIQASLGLPFVISELTDRAALSACQPVTDIFREGAATYPAGLDFAQFVYVRNGSKVDARMFAPLDNIPEDPATGSACATLAALLRDRLGADQTLTILQGEDMGRPSNITAVAEAKGVTIIGQAVKTMEGILTV